MQEDDLFPLSLSPSPLFFLLFRHVLNHTCVHIYAVEKRESENGMERSNLLDRWIVVLYNVCVADVVVVEFDF